ncbi:hypothetical protein D3C86_1510150 [compost metagenome]
MFRNRARARCREVRPVRRTPPPVRRQSPGRPCRRRRYAWPLPWRRQACGHPAGIPWTTGAAAPRRRWFFRYSAGRRPAARVSGPQKPASDPAHSAVSFRQPGRSGRVQRRQRARRAAHTGSSNSEIGCCGTWVSLPSLHQAENHLGRISFPAIVSRKLDQSVCRLHALFSSMRIHREPQGVSDVWPLL